MPTKKEHERKGFEPMLAYDQGKRQVFFIQQILPKPCMSQSLDKALGLQGVPGPVGKRINSYVTNETIGGRPSGLVG